MNVVDSSAWIAFFKDEPHAEKFAGPISNTNKLLVPSITLTGVFKFICRHQDGYHALAAISQMKKGLLVPLESNLAVTAAEIGLKLQLPLADSIIYATARKFDAVLWTQDVDFKNLPGVEYFR